MGWHGSLRLQYTRRDEQTTALDRHEGPLRVLQRLYPEGPGVCHHVLVHPPGGIVGGDVLSVQAELGPQAHALITTPGATRFYKSGGALAKQSVHATLAAGSRLEWLPLETIAYRNCNAVNRLSFDLAPDAEMMGWDVLALGLPAAGEAFDDPAAQAGCYAQCIELPGVWREQGTVHAHDRLLLDSSVGWAGHRVMGVYWFARGSALERHRKQAMLDTAHAALESHLAGRDDLHAGVTAPHDQVVVVRALAHRVEPLMQMMTELWSRWRTKAWDLPPCPPRVWRT